MSFFVAITSILEVVTQILGILRELFTGPVRDGACFLSSLRTNKENLNSEVELLRAVSTDLKTEVDRGGSSVTERSSRVNLWLRQVETLLDHDYDDFRRRYNESPPCCDYYMCRCGMLEDCKLAMEVKELLERTRDLIKRGEGFLANIDPLPPNRPASVEYIPIYGHTVGQEQEFEMALRLIQEGTSVGVVGIWGMGGMGKTTLLKRVNNHFHNNSATTDFDVVIFVTVGRNKNILQMQQDIGERLCISLSGDERRRAKLIFKSLRSKSFLLLMDDLWKMIDLESLGIPPLNSSMEGGLQQQQQQQQQKRKIVIMTRDQGVCNDMGCTSTSIVEMRLLTPEMSWNLFRMHLKNDALLERSSEVASLARDVAGECECLPLALVTVGKAMSRYKESYEWRNALQELERSAFPRMRENVLLQLKFSFERLEYNYMRRIIFLCFFLPEEHSYSKFVIAQLAVAIHASWKSAEGEALSLISDTNSGLLIASSDFDWKSAEDEALTLISATVNSGLLMWTGEGEQNVRLHDCVRDMLLLLVKTEVDKYGKIMLRWSLPRSTEQHKDWISDFFWRCQCAQMITMYGCHLDDLKMPNCSALRFLHWEGGKVRSFPPNFFNAMTCLRVLDLKKSNIEELPESFGRLENLRYLDLSSSRITKLPGVMERLRRLAILSLNFTEQLRDIPCSIFTGLRSLREFSIWESAFPWTWDDKNASGGDEDGHNDGNVSNGGRKQASLQNLDELKAQPKIHITLHVDVAIFSGLLRSKGPLLHSMEWLHMDFRNFEGNVDFDQLLKTIQQMKNLQKFELRNMKNLNTEENFQASDGSSPLTHLMIDNCINMCDLTWCKTMPRLEKLTVSACADLSVLLFSESSREDFSRLKFLHIEGCPKLSCIARCTLLFPSLELLTVEDCPELKSLSFEEQSAEKIKAIEGSEEWWNALEWENANIRSRFLPHFREEETDDEE